MAEPKFELAMNSGHDSLFHYENFRADYLANMLRDQKIHCSVPSHFNDPWDCKPWFDEACADDPVEFERCIRLFRQGGDIPENTTSEFDRDQRLGFVRQLSEASIFFLASHRIYCLTPWNKSQLFWSFYADKHRGICLEFDTNNMLVGSALKVRYFDEYPIWKLDDVHNPGKNSQMLLAKSSAWSHEDEFRIIGHKDWPTEFVDENAKPFLEGDFFRLPPNALKSIIAGHAADVRLIKAIVNEFAPGLPVNQAIRIPDKYDLRIEGA